MTEKSQIQATPLDPDEETLDPDDWHSLRLLAHRMVDDAIDHVKNVRDRPMWRQMPANVRSGFDTDAPAGPTPLGEVYSELSQNLMQYPMGNIHPRFWMWYMGAGNITGALGEFLAAIDGSNLGGGNNAAALIDRQVVNWCKQIAGLPDRPVEALSVAVQWRTLSA